MTYEHISGTEQDLQGGETESGSNGKRRCRLVSLRAVAPSSPSCGQLSLAARTHPSGTGIAAVGGPSGSPLTLEDLQFVMKTEAEMFRAASWKSRRRLKTM